MSKHNESNKNRRRNNRHAPKVRAGEFPRWSNGVLLNGISGRNDDRNRGSSSDRPGSPVGSSDRRGGALVRPDAASSPRPAVGRFVQQDFHGRKTRVLVLTRREASKGWRAPYSSQFERTKSSGKGSDFIARTRVHGRPVFLDSRSPKPTDLGRVYGFELVGENPSCSVYYARIILPEAIVMPTSITIDVATGRMVANNARLPKLSGWKSKRPIERAERSSEEEFDRFLREIETAPRVDYTAPGWEDFRSETRRDLDEWIMSGSIGCSCDDPDDGCDDDCCLAYAHGGEGAVSTFEAEIAEKQAMRPLNATWCHNCGCRICECDGTPMVDGQPYLMPAHLTQVRFPARVAVRKPRTPRYSWRW